VGEPIGQRKKDQKKKGRYEIEIERGTGGLRTVLTSPGLHAGKPRKNGKWGWNSSKTSRKGGGGSAKKTIKEQPIFSPQGCGVNSTEGGEECERVGSTGGAGQPIRKPENKKREWGSSGLRDQPQTNPTKRIERRGSWDEPGDVRRLFTGSKRWGTGQREGGTKKSTARACHEA